MQWEVIDQPQMQYIIVDFYELWWRPVWTEEELYVVNIECVWKHRNFTRVEQMYAPTMDEVISEERDFARAWAERMLAFFQLNVEGPGL